MTNSSFLNARTFDGFRKVVADEFSDIYVVDLGGNVRENPKLSGPKNNVFEIQTPVAISFLVKRKHTKDEPCKIFYARRDEYETAEDKLTFLATTAFEEIEFGHVKPDVQNNWINLASNDFDTLFPLSNRETKQAKRKIEERALFKLSSLGVVTARDEWVYDLDEQDLTSKLRYLIRVYNQDVEQLAGVGRSKVSDEVNYSIKWTRAVKNDLAKGKRYSFKQNKLIGALYRPFVKRYLYFAAELNEI